MAKITRVAQKLFGSTAPGSEIAEFGSKAAGAPVTGATPAQIQSLSQFLAGWNAACVATDRPYLEDMNALFYLAFYQIAYALQTGVPEWDSGTTYYIGSVVQDGTGILYKSLTDANLNNLVSDVTKWAKLACDGATFTNLSGILAGAGVIPAANLPTPTPAASAAEVLAGTESAKYVAPSKMISHEGVCKGWINFNGTGVIAIKDSFNVSGITDNGQGDYTVTWDVDFGSANYAAVGMASPCTTPAVGTAVLVINSKIAGSLRFNIWGPTADATYAADCADICILAIGDR